MNTIGKAAASVALLLWSSVAFAGEVDVNKADAETLAANLEGVGRAKAQAIVDYRMAHGPFASVDDLLKVKGIGPKILENNRNNIEVRAKASEKTAIPTKSR